MRLLDFPDFANKNFGLYGNGLICGPILLMIWEIFMGAKIIYEAYLGIFGE